MEFIQDVIQYPFLQRALIASLLASAACGVLGSYIIARRSSFMVGAVSHSLLGGIGLARYLQVVVGIAFVTPLCGAVVAALAAAFVITFFSTSGNARSDAVLSAIWTASVAIGICFVTAIPGYAEDLNTYLFGNILLSSAMDLYLMLALVLCILPAAWLFHARFLALCFNEEALTLRGISTFRTGLLLNVLTGLAIVLLSQIVGTVMVLALMVLPAAAAYKLARTLNMIMIIAAVFCMLSCTAGIAASYVCDWPAGATIIIIATVVYILASSVSWLIATARKKDAPEL